MGETGRHAKLSLSKIRGRISMEKANVIKRLFMNVIFWLRLQRCCSLQGLFVDTRDFALDNARLKADTRSRTRQRTPYAVLQSYFRRRLVDSDELQPKSLIKPLPVGCAECLDNAMKVTFPHIVEGRIIGYTEIGRRQ